MFQSKVIKHTPTRTCHSYFGGKYHAHKQAFADASFLLPEWGDLQSSDLCSESSTHADESHIRLVYMAYILLSYQGSSAESCPLSSTLSTSQTPAT